jgi:hypothetical protein
MELTFQNFYYWKFPNKPLSLSLSLSLSTPDEFSALVSAPHGNFCNEVKELLFTSETIVHIRNDYFHRTSNKDKPRIKFCNEAHILNAIS